MIIFTLTQNQGLRKLYSSEASLESSFGNNCSGKFKTLLKGTLLSL